MTPDQFALVRRLIHTAAIDQTRAYSATWSLSRMRTVLMDKVISGGHRVVEIDVPGTPTFSRSAKLAVMEDEPDLKVMHANGSQSIFIDMLCGSAQADTGVMDVVSTYDKVMRLATGRSDLLLISADADAYERVRTQPSQLRKDEDPTIRVLAAVLPAATKVSATDKHRVTLGDVSMEAWGVKSTAFGTARVVCAVYVRWEV